MAATLSELRTAVTQRLRNDLPGVQVYQYPVDNVDAPAIVVAGLGLDTGTFGDATSRFEVELVVLVSRRHVDQIDVLDAMLSLSGDLSIWQSVNADPSLDDTVAHCVVQSVGDYREIAVADVGYYSAIVRLTGML